MLASPASRLRWLRAAVLLAGLLVPQAVLFGPSLVGRTILLPLDVLAAGYYLPTDPTDPANVPTDRTLSDLVLQLEIYRQFAVGEVRAGRVPLWNPYNYTGSPFLAANQSAVLSPYRVLDYLWPSPVALAWGQVLRALVAGIGAYLFFRRVVRVDFAPAAIGAWCFPIGGFLILWAGFPVGAAVTWLPWILLATDGAVRRPRGWSGIGLALTTAATLLSGHSATGVQVLLGAGLYAVWCLFDQHGRRDVFTRRGVASMAMIGGGWSIGILLAAPQLAPTLEYLGESARISARTKGTVDTASSGSAALPQFVLPYFYGSVQPQSLYLVEGNRIESAASGYAGLLLTLVAAPLAWCSRRHRSMVLLWIALAIVAAGQTLAVPGLSWLFESPPLNLLRNNRLVFLTGWCALAAAVVGLDVLRRWPGWRPWMFRVALLPGVLGLWCVYRAIAPPVELESMLAEAADMIRTGQARPPLVDAAALGRVRQWFLWSNLSGAAVCALAVALVLTLRSKMPAASWFVWGVGVLAVGELTVSGFGVNPQTDPSLYYPRLPVLETVRAAPPGRMVANNCLPANLNQTHGLADVRGYDGADPVRITELLDLFRDKSASFFLDYAMTQWFVPTLPSPLADALNLRYVVACDGPQQSLLVNERALPRVYVPRRVEVVNDKERRLWRLGEPGFNAREVVYVESDTPLAAGPVEGEARIVDEVPSRVTIELGMRTAGVVVLADRWAPGWNAYLAGNGTALPVLRANHALRGVAVPSGDAVLEFRYEPASFTWGLCGASLALLLLVGWSVVVGKTSGTAPLDLAQEVPTLNEQRRSGPRAKAGRDHRPRKKASTARLQTPPLDPQHQ